jgi:hypothetical protein
MSPGINSGKYGGTPAASGSFGGTPASDYTTLKELADEIGTHRESLTAIKSGQRGMSVELARKVAKKTGEKAGTLYAESQVRSLKSKAATKSISPNGTLQAAQRAMKAVSGSFLPSEIDKKDPRFIAAAEQLRDIALVALDYSGNDSQQMGPKAGSANDQGPTLRTGDSTAVAEKGERVNFWDLMEERRAPRDPFGRAAQKESDREPVKRDASGAVIPDGEKIERDAHGRRIR